MGGDMERKEYEAFARDFPDLMLLHSWVEEFYRNIEVWQKSGPGLGVRAYRRADQFYQKIYGFIQAMETFGMIDSTRRWSLVAEFIMADKVREGSRAGGLERRNADQPGTIGKEDGYGI